jgi:hypothetical protein
MRNIERPLLIAVVAVTFLGGGSFSQALTACQTRISSGTSRYLEMYVRQDPKTYRLRPADLTLRTILTLGPEISG